jgi:putative transcriptional regulator
MSRVGADLVEAFTEMAAHLRGDVEAESYVVATEILTPDRIQKIRRTVARSTREFESEFGVPARTMESYEQGRRRPDAAMTALLRIIEKEPEAALRALAS